MKLPLIPVNVKLYRNTSSGLVESTGATTDLEDSNNGSEDDIPDENSTDCGTFIVNRSALGYNTLTNENSSVAHENRL